LDIEETARRTKVLITPSNMDALFIAFSKQFEMAYMGEPTPLLTSIGSKIPSNTRDQRYPFVQSISGAMRKWTGERQVQNVVVDGFVVTNSKWENTLSIQRTDIEDDQYGVYSSMLIPNLARHAKLLPDQQIVSAITTNATGYDGKAFFATDHPVDPSDSAKTNPNTGLTTQSNSLTGKPLGPTYLPAVQAAMQNFVGPDGLPMGCYGDTLLVPPSLEYTADVLANSTFYPNSINGNSAVFGAQANPWKGRYNVVSSPWLPDTGDPATAVWYLLDCRYPNMRPFFWQEREAPQLVSLVDPSNPVVFFQDVFYMGARARGAAAASLWFKAIKVSGS
jgi:phage major head subunit gpT-like protein